MYFYACLQDVVLCIFCCLHFSALQFNSSLSHLENAQQQISTHLVEHKEMLTHVSYIKVNFIHIYLEVIIICLEVIFLASNATCNFVMFF